MRKDRAFEGHPRHRDHHYRNPFQDTANYHDLPDGGYREEVYSLRVPAGKRTYFFDVKSTRSGDDYFLTITESKRIDDGRYEKHKLFLYKEDFGKFIRAIYEAVEHIREECLPGYDFEDIPEVYDEYEQNRIDPFNRDARGRY